MLMLLDTDLLTSEISQINKTILCGANFKVTA